MTTGIQSFRYWISTDKWRYWAERAGRCGGKSGTVFQAKTTTSTCRRFFIPVLLVEVCISTDGLPLSDHAGLLRCIDEAACTITDDRLQMAVLRDPRCVRACVRESEYFKHFGHATAYDGSNTMQDVGYSWALLEIRTTWLLKGFDGVIMGV